MPDDKKLKITGEVLEVEALGGFLEEVFEQGKRKAELYDGVESAGRSNSNMDIDFFLRCTTEELGEVASAITRSRYELAKAECIDLAHTAFLIYLAISSRERSL